MFHSICPECGREIAPTVRECPVCDGLEQAEPVLAGVVEASARTQTPAEQASSSGRSAQSLNTAPVEDRSQAKALPLKEELVGRGAQTENLSHTENAARALLAERTIAESVDAPITVALLENVADLQAPVQEPASWRRKNGRGTVPLPAQNRSAEMNAEASGEPSAPKVEAVSSPLDAPEAMKLLAAPVAIPQPEPSTSMPHAVPVASPLTAEQEQNAATALHNLSSGVAALVEPPVQAVEAETQKTEAPQEVAIATPEIAQAETIIERETESSSHAVAAVPLDDATAEAAAEPEALVPEILDAKSAAEKSIEARAADLVARLNTAPVKTSGGREDSERVGRSVRTRTVESRPLETHGVENLPVETHALNTKSWNGKPVEAKPVEAKPVDARLLDTTPVDARPVDANVAEVKSNDVHLSDAANAPADQLAGESIAQDAHVLEAAPAAVAPESTSAATKSAPAPQPAAHQHTSAKFGKFGRLLRMAAEGHKPAPEATRNSAPVQDAARPSQADVAPTPPVADSPNTDAAPLLSHAHADADSGPLAEAQVADAPLAVAPVADAAGSEAANAEAPIAEAAPLQKAPADAQVAPLETSRQLPLPLYPAPVSPANAAVLPMGRRAFHQAPLATTPGSDLGSVLFSENAPLLTNKLRQTNPEPALVDKNFPIPQPVPADMKFSFAPAVPIPPSAGSVRSPHSEINGPAPRWGRLVRNPAIAKSAVRPAAPAHETVMADPAPSLTLPGPMLTPALVAFRDPELTPAYIAFGPKRKRWGNAWLFVALLGGTTLGVGLTSVLSNLPRPEPSFKDVAKEAPAAAAAATNVAAEAAPAPQTKPSTHPIPKSIELSGIRIVGDASGGEQVRFTVVNHGPTRFTDGVVYVALRSANARPGQPPIYRFTFPAPNLGPYESREMSSIAKKVTDDASLPGWQDLRAEIEIGQP